MRFLSLITTCSLLSISAVQLAAQNIKQKTANFSQATITSRFGGTSVNLYSFSDDGREFYVLRDRDINTYYSRTDAEGYTYYDMEEAGPDAVAVFDAQSGKLVDDFHKYFLAKRPLGRKVLAAFDRYCYLSSDFDCNEAEFEKHRVVYFDRLPQGWVNAAQKVKLNYSPGACMRRHLTTDSTLSISLLNVVDENKEEVVATIPNIRLFRTPEEARSFNIRFESANYLSTDRKLSKSELRELTGPEIKNTRVVYDATTLTGYVVLYLQSQHLKTEGKTVVKILRFSFKDFTAREIYSSPVYDNSRYNFSFRGKLRIASKDVLTSQYFIHHYSSYRTYSGAENEDSIEVIRFNPDTAVNSVSIFSLMPPPALQDIVIPDAQNHKRFILETVSGDTAVYSYYDNVKTFDTRVYFVNYKTGQVLENWLLQPYKGEYSGWTPDIFFSPGLKNIAAIQTYKIKDQFWNGVQILDYATEKVASCDLAEYQLAYVKKNNERIAAQQKELEEQRKSREKKEEEYQRLLRENMRLAVLLKSGNGQATNCVMCNGSGKIEKFGNHLERVAYTDSQGRTIYHNVETTTGSFFDTCPKCHGSGKQ